ncbi:MAG TPA: DUF202 domain-containing protein [Rhizomicrobium sp.]
MNIKMAADRTLMAWVSTGLSLLTFGFVIYKILAEHRVEGVVIPGGNTPINVGMFLIVSGTIAILMGIGSYIRTLLQLRPLQRFGLVQPSLILALLMAGLGLFLCIGIVARQL